MSAHNNGRSLSVREVQAVAKAILRTLWDGSDECVVWAGAYGGNDLRFPQIKMPGTNMSPRALLAPGNYGTGQVMMTCSTPGCVNPRHMVRVKSARPRDIGQGRCPLEGMPKSSVFATKVTDEIRESALRLLGSGSRQADVAKELGLSQSTISRIARDHAHT